MQRLFGLWEWLLEAKSLGVTSKPILYELRTLGRSASLFPSLENKDELCSTGYLAG
jgi:hypothetical protein